MNPINSRFEVARPGRIHSWEFALRAILRVAALLGPILIVVACNSDLLSDAPSANCKESGVQCQLAAGPLGVCERTHCDLDETPPCFQCTPQH
ncbi:MAG: hypothetical protein AAEJ52_20575 [Myxococcota bacterium]